MAVVVPVSLRSAVGRQLTWSEEDANFQGLADGVRTVSLAVDAISGAGPGASLLILSATAQTFKFTAAGAASPTGQSIQFAAQTVNLSGTVTFTATAYDSTGASLGVIPLSGSGTTRTLAVANFAAAAYAVVTASLGAYSDQITVVRVSDGAAGANAVVGMLTNESAAVAADSAGVVSDFSGAVGVFKVFSGTTDVTGAGPAYSLASTSNVTAVINSTSGAYAITAMSAANGTATFQAVYAGVTLTKIFNISKSVAGSPGANGVNGTNGANGTNGINGTNGLNGSDGLNNATVLIYQRANSAPALPSATVTYTFATSVLTGLNNGWSTSIPAADGRPLYVSAATASSTGAADTITSGEWASVSTLAQDGINSATVYLFQRTSTSTPPSLPSASVTYTFSTGAASGVNNGWTQTMPTTGGAYRWVTTATALSSTATDTIATGEWASASLLAQDGANGANGTNGTNGTNGANGTNGSNGANGVSVFLGSVYIQASSAPSAPTGGSFDFSNATLTPPSGWTASVPAPGANPTYRADYTFTTSTPGASVTAGTWSSPVQVAAAAAPTTNYVVVPGPYLLKVTGTSTPVTCVAGVQFNTDGTTSKKASGTSSTYNVTSTPWFVGTPGITYYVRIVQRSLTGTGTLGGASSTVWNSLAVAKNVTLTATAGNLVDAVLDYQISSDSAGSTIVSTGVIELHAEST